MCQEKESFLSQAFIFENWSLNFISEITSHDLMEHEKGSMRRLRFCFQTIAQRWFDRADQPGLCSWRIKFTFERIVSFPGKLSGQFPFMISTLSFELDGCHKGNLLSTSFLLDISCSSRSKWTRSWRKNKETSSYNVKHMRRKIVKSSSDICIGKREREKIMLNKIVSDVSAIECGCSQQLLY